MAIYIAFTIFFCCWGLFILYIQQPEKRSRYSLDLFYLIPVFVFAWFIMGFRGISVGMDTKSYFDLYHQYAKLPFHEIFVQDTEPGWGALTWSLGNIGCPYLIYQILFSALYCYLSFRFILSISELFNRKYTLAITIIFITTTYLLAFNIARQMMAVMFIINAWNFWRLDKKSKAIIFFCIGILFHYSALLGLIILFFWMIKDIKRYRIISILILIIVFLNFYIIIEYIKGLGVYVNYINNATQNFQEANLSKFVWGIIAIHSLWIVIRPKIFNSSHVFIAICCLIVVITNLIASQITYFERLGLYFSPFVAILYPIVGDKIPVRALRILYFIGVVIMYAIWFVLGSRSEQYKYALM